MALSDVAIRKAKPRPKAYKMSDSGGLYLLIKPSGGKWWRYKYRFGGKEKLLSLGAYPEVSLAAAREKHLEARKTLATGNDPSRTKKEAKAKLALSSRQTFKAVALEWFENRQNKWLPKHSKKIIRCLEADAFPALGTRPIAEISASELLDVVRKVEKRGVLTTAHRLLQYISQIYRFAIITDRAKQNPADALRGALQPVKIKNNAFLKEAELQEFLLKLDAYDGEPVTKLALKFLLLTFVRTSEQRAATWAEMDFEKAIWKIPAERMKMREAHIVPLSTQAIAVLRELRQLTGQRSLLFPNRNNPSACMSENTMLYALYRMGYHGRATGHGFRATASTILNENGFKSDIIERQLAHAERDGVRAAYNHAEYLPERRKMMQWWANYLDKAAKK